MLSPVVTRLRHAVLHHCVRVCVRPKWRVGVLWRRLASMPLLRCASAMPPAAATITDQWCGMEQVMQRLRGAPRTTVELVLKRPGCRLACPTPPVFSLLLALL